MSGDTTRRSSDNASLERIREASDAVEKSTPAIVLEKVRDRWQTVASIVVLAIASYFLSIVDGGLSLDAMVFAALAILLLLYFLQTLVTDVRME